MWHIQLIVMVEIQVGFTSVDYTVTERDMGVFVCVRNDGARAKRPYSVALLPAEGNISCSIHNTICNSGLVQVVI